jgi:hypothetical protein
MGCVDSDKKSQLSERLLFMNDSQSINFVAVREKEVLPGISLVVSCEVAAPAPLPCHCHCLHSSYLFPLPAKLPKERLEYFVFFSSFFFRLSSPLHSIILQLLLFAPSELPSVDLSDTHISKIPIDLHPCQ